LPLTKALWDGGGGGLCQKSAELVRHQNNVTRPLGRGGRREEKVTKPAAVEEET
jgi:hypothetical protein